MKKVLLLIVMACFYAGIVHGQKVVRNFGFEDIDSKGNILSWEPGNTKSNFVIKIDTTVARSGKRSFFIEAADTTKDRGAAGAGTSVFASNMGTKRIVRISAYIKTENLQDGMASIGLQLNGDNGSIRELNSNGQSPAGTANWKQHIIELRITPDVKNIRVGFSMTGKGKAWFDDFEVSFDDIPLGNSMTLP